MTYIEKFFKLCIVSRLTPILRQVKGRNAVAFLENNHHGTENIQSNQRFFRQNKVISCNVVLKQRLISV